MDINFVPQSLDPLNSKSDRWRNWVFVIVILFLPVLFLFRDVRTWSWGVFKHEVNRIQEFTDSLNRNVVGGDVVSLPLQPPKPRAENITGVVLNPARFTAKSMLVKDHENGIVLFGKNEYESWPMASITKLISALVLQNIEYNWTSSTFAAVDAIPDTFVVSGSLYALADLWTAGLVGSANRAILSLVDGSGLSRGEFVKLMNDKARELGMMNTVLVEPTGLDERNVTTASDLALLISEVMRHEKIKTALRMREFTITPLGGKTGRHMWNTDWLLLRWIPHSFIDLKGGKTGYIPASGYNFVMQVGDEAGNLLDVVILGASSNETRFMEAKEAAEWVFNNFEWRVKGGVAASSTGR